MANLQVKGIDDALYEQLKERAKSEDRSISQELVFILKRYLARRDEERTPAQVLLDLSGSWEDDRSEQEIVQELRNARKTSGTLKSGF